MNKLLKSDKIKITPVFNNEEKQEFIDNGFELVGLYVNEGKEGPVINIGYPSIASYNATLGNMFGFENSNGIYFATGKFPESNDRPIYIISITDTLTIDSYSQINASIIGDYDLYEILSGEEKREQIKRA